MEEIIKEIEDKLESAKNDTLEKQAMLNILYYAGKQWIAYDKVNKRIFEPPAEPNQVRFVGNRIQPIIRTELSKLTKNKPIVNVIPASSDDDDVKSAHIAEKVLDNIWYKLNLQNMNKELAMWCLCTGTAFIKPYWNPNKGDKLIDEEGKPFKTGDIDVEVVNLFEILIDPSAKRWEDVKWVCHKKVRTIDYVKEVYGKEVQPEKGILETNLFENQLKDIYGLGAVKQKQTEDSVVVKEYWEKPSVKYPNGRRITVANGQLLFQVNDIGFGKEDSTERQLPFFPFTHITIPGRVIGQSVIENLIPIQKEYNKTRSQIIQNKNLVSNPPWVVEDGTLTDDIRGVPGEVITYQAGRTPPHMEQPKELSQTVYKNLEQCTEEFYFISGQNETSHGNVPTGVKSGVAISFLQEQDDSKMAITIENFEKCIEQYSSYILKIINIKYDIPRTINIVGKNNSVEVIDFIGSNLTSTDVRVQAGSSIPTTKAAKQQWITNLVELGVLNPIEDKELIIKMLDTGFTDNMYDDFAIDVNQALSEQDKWKKGDISPVVRDFYEHPIHIREHNKFRKSDEYEQLPPELQQIIDQHVIEHLGFAANMPVTTQIDNMVNPISQPEVTQ